MTNNKQSNMKYAVKYTLIPSRWFDTIDRRTKLQCVSIYERMGGYKALNVYLQLYKFRIYNQENQHTFMTSIQMLRKETRSSSLDSKGNLVYGKPYPSEDVLEYLRTLSSMKLITVENLTRWDRMYDNEGKIKDERLLHITATTKLDIDNHSIKNKFNTKEELTIDDYYIYIPFDLFEFYESVGFNEKYYALYCLIKKWSHKNGYCSMSAVNLGEVLGFSKNTINNMFYEMQQECVLVTKTEENQFSHTESHHYILDGMEKEYARNYLERFEEEVSNTRRFNKAK